MQCTELWTALEKPGEAPVGAEDHYHIHVRPSWDLKKPRNHSHFSHARAEYFKAQIGCSSKLGQYTTVTGTRTATWQKQICYRI